LDSSSVDKFCFEFNTNNAKIEVVVKSIPNYYIGGLIGKFIASSSVTIQGNINNAMVNVSNEISNRRDDNRNEYAGGIFGFITSAAGAAAGGSITFLDTANYGNVIGIFKSCGIACSEQTNNNVLRNCINRGIVEGKEAYGFSNVVGEAHSVVNLGKVSSLWGRFSGTLDFVYTLGGTCENCGEDVTKIALNETDGRYHDDNGEEVAAVLNEESNSKKYSRKWDRQLMIRAPITVHIGGNIGKDIELLIGATMEDCNITNSTILNCHFGKGDSKPTIMTELNRTTIVEEGLTELTPFFVVTMSGLVEEREYVKVGGSVNEVTKLKDYIGSSKHIVGDSDKHSVIGGGDTIDQDLRIVVMDFHASEMIMDGSQLASDIDLNEVAESASVMSGVDKSGIIVRVESDESGYATRILIFVPDKEQNNAIVDAVCNNCL